VDAAWERSGTVLPLGFDMIVRPGDGLDADERVMQWLTSEGHRFRGMLERLRGKVELGVQVIWDQRVVGESVAQGNDEIRHLRAEMTSKPKGLAYFYQPKIERALRRLGGTAEARYYEGGVHAFHAFVFAKQARRCWRDQFEFLGRHASPSR